MNDEVTATAPTLTAPPTKHSWEQKIRDKYESFWVYPEAHPARLGTHIALRGVYSGATLSTLIALPVLIYRRKPPPPTLMNSLGKITLCGGMVGGAILGLVAAERLYHLDSDGIGDRSYRIAYNWGQTKWDWFALDGALLSAALLRRPFGGILPAAAIGSVLGTFLWVAATATAPK